MKKKSLIIVVVISVFLFSGLAIAAPAGKKTASIQSEVDQLAGISKSLNKINDRLLKILDNPPDGTGPNLNGALGRLNATSKHLEILNGFIDSAVEVLGTPPSDPEGVSALEEVQVAAEGISKSIDGYLTSPQASNTPSQFNDALSIVKNIADEIVSKSTTNQACSDHTTQDECEDDDNCEWYVSPVGKECRDSLE